MLLSLVNKFELPEKLVLETIPVISNLERKLMCYEINPQDYLESNRASIERMISEIVFKG